MESFPSFCSASAALASPCACACVGVSVGLMGWNALDGWMDGRSDGWAAATNNTHNPSTRAFIPYLQVRMDEHQQLRLHALAALLGFPGGRHLRCVACLPVWYLSMNGME